MLPIALLAIGIAGCNEKEPEQTMNEDGELDAPIPTPEPFDTSVFDEEIAPSTQASVGLNWETPYGWGNADDSRKLWLESWDIEGASEHLLAFVFSWGPDNTQSLRININRWGSQFRMQDGSRPTPVLETWEQGPLTVTSVTFTGQSMVGLQLDELELGAEGAKMVGAIVEGGPNGIVLFRLSGPTPEVDEHTPDFLELIRSITLRDGAPTP